ncbi:MAG: heat-inducible transcriptional repressor HrcA [Terriglobia bacterium]
MDLTGTNELTAREQDILKSVVQYHIVDGKPVGSQFISNKYDGNLSPATVRNIMADLEEAGYLAQPHTSAGRVPTDKGYRFFVDRLLKSSKLDKADEEFIHFNLFRPDSHQSVVERVTQTISQATHNVGFVISPSLDQNHLKHIEFIQLPDSRILVIMVGKTGIVQNRIVRVDEKFVQTELDQTARFINENFQGQSLFAIRNEILRKMGEEKALYDRLLQNVILLCNRGLIDEVSEENVDIYVDGTSNLLSQPEFADAAQLQALFKTFEEKSRLVKILNECLHSSTGDGIRIIIGSENSIPGMQNYTLISSPILPQDQNLGSVGILGPTRMEYARAITIVDYVAKLYGQIFDAD